MGVRSAQQSQHMKADATITTKKKKNKLEWKKKWPKLHCTSGPQEEDKTDSKSKSQKHCLKHTRNSSRESSATIYELQKIMNIEVLLNAQHFKTYGLKKKHEHKGSFKYP